MSKKEDREAATAAYEKAKHDAFVEYRKVLIDIHKACKQASAECSNVVYALALMRISDVAGTVVGRAADPCFESALDLATARCDELAA